jgi:PIF1-like helicase
MEERVDKRKTIGRLPILNIGRGEKWFLRLLLLHVKGASSFQALKNFNGQLLTTYKEAAEARGLIASDNKFEAALTEAAHYQMPHQIRILFCTILAFGRPTNPLSLYQEFEEAMSSGLHPLETAGKLCRTQLERELESMGSSLTEFSIPLASISFEMANQLPTYHLPEAELNETANGVTEEQLLLALNNSQRDIVKEILEAVDLGISFAVFMEGPGGTGKTFIYNTLYNII